MRRFYLYRKIDDSGVSGTGYIAEGFLSSSGQVVLCWITDTPSIGVYNNLENLMAIHGHGNHTVLEWVDEEE